VSIIPFPAAANSWIRVDLASILDGIERGEIVGPQPSLMLRSDGIALLYPGEVHSLAGEPESGKGWLSLATALEVIRGGGQVLYLDFEDGPASIVARLLALGATFAQVIERFVYVRPMDPFAAPAFYELVRDLKPAPALAVIDGLSEAYALLGLDVNSNTDAATFLSTIPRPLAAGGAAVLEIDHVVKAKEGRGRFSIGAQHKLAGVAAAYSTDIVTSPSRTSDGLIRLRVEKDRHGHVRGHAHGGVIALARIKPHDNGTRITVTLDPPDSTDDDSLDGEFRPTQLMERVSRYVEENPGAGLNQIRDNVRGKAAWVDTARSILIREDYIRVKPSGQKQLHHHVKPYRVPASQPRPNHVPDTAQPTASPRPHPLRGTRQDTVQHNHHQHTNRVPDPDADLERIQAKFSDDPEFTL